MRSQSNDLPKLEHGCVSHPLEQTRTDEKSEAPSLQATKITWLILPLIVLSTVGLRVRLSATSLERDEGEYAYIAQLILQGEIPFTQAYTMKYPGVPYVYAAFLAVFGQTDVAIHLGLLIINALSVVLVFLLAKRLFNPQVGWISACSFAFLSLSRSTLGFTANAEHFVVLPTLAAILLLLQAVEQERRVYLLGSGFLFGVAVLMKQHAALFALFGVLYLLIHELARDGRSPGRLFLHLLLLSVSVVIPVVMLWLYLWVEGAFAPFWFWTFLYPRDYVSMVPWEVGKVSLMNVVGLQISHAFGFYVLALAGAASILWSRWTRQRALFLLLFTGFSFLTLCPGLRFSAHYFLLFMPAVSLLAGVGAAALGQLGQRFGSPARIALLVTLLALLCGFSQQFRYFFWFSPPEILNVTYPTDLNVMKELGLYVRDHSLPDDRIAVLGSEPEIYFYARRRAATKYIYTYPLMEPQHYSLQMQEEMIAEMERWRPRYIALVRDEESWSSFVNPDAPQLISQWPQKNMAKHYRRVVVADMISINHTTYVWQTDAISYKPLSDRFVVLYERISAPGQQSEP